MQEKPEMIGRTFKAWWPWLLLWLGALWLSQVIPPMQSPDETNHNSRAYMISLGQLLSDKPPPGTPANWGGAGTQMDENWADYIRGLADVRMHADARPVQHERMRLRGEKHWAGTTTYSPTSGMDFYIHLIYAPHATAFWIARQADLSMNHTYLLIKAFVLGASTVLLAWAWRLYPLNPLVLGLMTMPMMAFQALSPTIDGLSTSLALLSISLFLRLQAHRATRLGFAATSPEIVRERQAVPGGLDSRWFVALCAATFVLVSCRLNLLPLLLLPALLAWQSRSRREWALCLVLVLACVAWTGFALATAVDGRAVRSMSTGQIALAYLRHPTELPALLWRTFTDAEHLAIYRHTFVGVLGWLDTPLSVWGRRSVYAGLFLLLVLTVRDYRRRDRALELWSLSARGLWLGMALVSVLLTEVLLALTWNDHPTRFIEGIQGRYFIAAAMLAATGLTPLPAGGRPQWSPLSVWLAVPIGVFFLGLMAVTLLGKYDFVPLF